MYLKNHGEKNVETNKKFTIIELAAFDGKNGKLSYIGYKGRVYDVTDSSQWIDGDHLGHLAGQNLTDEMEIAPHGEEVLERMKTVGVLAES
jgi:predicted heme/steroid binding protein